MGKTITRFVPKEFITIWSPKKIDHQRNSLLWIWEFFNENSSAKSSLSFFILGRSYKIFSLKIERLFGENQKKIGKKLKKSISDFRIITFILVFIVINWKEHLGCAWFSGFLNEKSIGIFRSKIVLLLISVFQGSRKYKYRLENSISSTHEFLPDLQYIE